MKHLLITNDFPPKMGGIQSYLWELWRRLPPDETVVYTTPYEGSAEFDAAQAYRIIRAPQFWLAPVPQVVADIKRVVAEVKPDIVLLDPAVPIGWCGPQLAVPYGVVLHGSEVTVPGRLPGSQQALARVLRGAGLVICAGDYPRREAEHAAGGPLPSVVIPPGVDPHRFRPLSTDERSARRRALGWADEDVVVLGLSRLVPRKGFDTVIDAVARLQPTHPNLRLAIGGSGRDRPRLERRAVDRGARIQFLGRVSEDDLPATYAAADVFAMCCRSRWAGLEQEGFGIVFVEAAAAGLPQIAGRSGGSHEAVVDGVTGWVIDPPDHVGRVASALERMLINPDERRAMGHAARLRAMAEFDYDQLASRLDTSLTEFVHRVRVTS
jgi:phosphatidyl-myo-inositol dimannoside synthase